MRIDEMTSKEFAKALQADPIVFLPFGATEAHGAHLPLGTDSFQPEALCVELAEDMGGLVAPLVPYGQHSSTRNMPGTIDIQAETLKALVKDILDSLHRNGVRKVVLISGHAGSIHLAAIKNAAEETVRSHDLQLMVLTDYDIAYKFPLSVNPDYPDGHGGMLETSRILALRPELVKARRPKGKGPEQRYLTTRDPERCYPQQMVGDATKATAELGAEANQFIKSKLVALIKKNFGE